MEVASAFVSILPSAAGFGKKLSQELAPQVSSAGRAGGEKYADGFAPAASRLKGFGARLRATTNKAADDAGKESGERLSSKIGGALKGLAITAAGFAGVDFFKDAISQASDLNESTTKIQAIFGDATGAVQDFAAKGGKALGQTRNEVLDSAASFGTFGKAAGLTGQDLAKFSTGFAGLSTDLASFFNEDPADAAEAIGAALRGEAEPIRRYGVLLDAATLQNEAFRLGLIKNTKTALTPQQKVLAAQAAIYRQTKDAQGDFARTSGGLANQQRILAATFTDLKTNIGSALLPIVLRVASAFAKFFSQMQTGEGAGGQLVSTVEAIGSALAAAYGFVTRNSSAFKALGAAFAVVAAATAAHSLALAVNSGALRVWFVQTRIVQAATKAWAAIQWVLNAALSANPIGLVVVALVGLVAGLVIAYKQSETFRRIVQGAWAAIKTGIALAWNKVIRPVFMALWNFVGTTLPNAFRAGKAVMSAVWGALKTAMAAVWNRGIKPVFDFLKNYITVTIPTAFRNGRALINTVWTAIKDAVARVWNKGISPVFGAVKTFIMTTIPNAFKAGRALIDTVWTGIKNRIARVWNLGIRPAFDAVKNFITKTLPNAFTTGGTAIKDAWNKIKGYVARPINFVIGTVLNRGILAAFNSVAGSILGKKAPHINSLPLVKFAQGSEDHRAQIARPGDMRLWAEPETGGEAYIPLHPRKRARSTHILGQVAQRFGYQLHQFANGGTLVKAGKHLRQLGYSVAEGPPPFGPVHRVHTANSAHYRGLALDINHGAGTSRAEQAALDKIVPYLKGLGLRVIWRSAGHFNHLHTEATGKGSILGRIAGAAGDLLGNLDPRKLINKGLDKLSGIPGLGSPFAKTIGGVPRKLAGMLVTKAKDMLSAINPFGDTSDSGGGGGIGGASRWAGVARQVLGELGRPGSELGALLRRIQFESGGNPRAVNLTDSNARAGHPSRGLMQTIPATFNAYAGKYRSRGINDPLANIYAGANYAIKRYGSLRAIDPRVRPKGYDQGGWLQPGMTMVENRTGKPEPVLNPEQWAALSKSGAGVQFNAPVYTQTPQEFARQLVAEQRLHEALHPTFG